MRAVPVVVAESTGVHSSARQPIKKPAGGVAPSGHRLERSHERKATGERGVVEGSAVVDGDGDCAEPRGAQSPPP